MSRTISSTVHPIQRCMAASNPSAWWDGLVVDTDGATVTVALLNDTTAELRIVGPCVHVAVGEPVAVHPVAQLLSTSAILTTARAAQVLPMVTQAVITARNALSSRDRA